MKINDEGMRITEPIRFALDKLPKDFEGGLTLRRRAFEKAGTYARVMSDTGMTLEAGDDAGMMYAILDVADAIRKKERLGDCEITPYLDKRGIKFNIPLDARVPSYSDAGTSAWKNIANMWDMSFWTEFLDRMAENKYNVLSLWTLSPFPALVRIPEFPEACVDDVMASTRPVKATTRAMNMYSEDMRGHLARIKKIPIEEKTRFWNSVMAYAKNRCISVYLFTWNVYVFGTEGNPYGITDDQYNSITRDYFYYGTKALMQAYPLLAGIGITTGENMSFQGSSENNNDPGYKGDDIDFTLNTYGRAVADYLKEHPERDFKIIHRMHMARYADIVEAFSRINLKIDVSFKYSQAHMYSSTAPQFIKSFLDEKDPEAKFWLTVRNDDYYMTRWGNPSYAREYLQNMPAESMSGFYMGPDGLVWGRDFFSRDKSNNPLFIDKMWYMFKIWGQLSYNISLDDAYFAAELRERFGLTREASEKLYNCWAEASCIIPELTSTHWHNFDFQWYPEGCCMRDDVCEKICFADINEFMECPAITGGNYESVRETARRMVRKQETGKVSAEAAAHSILRHAKASQALLEELREYAPGNAELSATLDDIWANACLGFYYGNKLKAALNLCIYKLNAEEARKTQAVALLSEAAAHWKNYSSLIYKNYKPQILPRLGDKIDVTDFDELTDFDVLIARDI